MREGKLRSVSVNADPADPCTARIPGDVCLQGRALADWGLHMADVSLAQGDLVRLVETQLQAYATR